MKKVKVELHTHTNYSYDTDLSLREIIKKCKEHGIDVLAVTDHNEIEGALRLSKIAPFKVIVGEEIKTKEGEVIGLFLNKFIKPGLSIEETLKEIKKQKGIVYVPHPFDKTTRKTAIGEFLSSKYYNKIDIVEVHNGRSIFNSDNQKSVHFNKKIKKTPGVGSDAHTIFEFGRNYILMEDFKNSKDFLEKLNKAKLFKKSFISWVFLITKFVRFRKKYFKTTLKNQLLAENVICDLCGSKRYKVKYIAQGKFKSKYYISDDSYGSHEQMVECIDCGLVYCYPISTEKKVINRYSKFVDYKYENEREARKVNQRKILINIEELINKKGKVLDVGAATGAFLEVAREMKWKIDGIEPSIWATKLAREKHNLNITNGTLENAKFKKKSYDAVTLIDVIEHVNSPRRLLTLANSYLKKGGIMTIVTPDYGSLLSKFMGEKWWHVRPDHVFYFKLETIRLLVESLGFEIIKVNRPGWNFSYNYWTSRLKHKMPYLYNIFNFFEKVHIFNFFTKRYFSINFQDSLEVYIRQKK